MNLIAHRGNGNHDYGENTLGGIIYSLKQDYISGVELDVRITKDDKIVVTHDYTINKVSDGSGIVQGMTYEELLKHNFGTKKNSTKIKLLNEVLKEISKLKTDKIIIIDVKLEIGDESKMAKLIAKVINKYKDLNIIVASFNNKLINIIRKLTKHKIGGVYLIPKVEDFKKYNAYFFRYQNFKNYNTNKPLFYWTINNSDFIHKYCKEFKKNIYLVTDIPYVLNEQLLSCSY